MMKAIRIAEKFNSTVDYLLLNTTTFIPVLMVIMWFVAYIALKITYALADMAGFTGYSIILFWVITSATLLLIILITNVYVSFQIEKDRRETDSYMGGENNYDSN